MTRYRLPEILGGGEFDGEMLWSGCAGAVPDYDLHVPGVGTVRITTTVALTPVDTTPPEPEPGAWLIGKYVCVRMFRNSTARLDTPPRTAWVAAGDPDQPCQWDELWRDLGGPGVTIRRLIPEPAPVELPWRISWGGHLDVLEVDLTVPTGEFVHLGIGTGYVHMTDAQATAAAHALLSAAAARAVREVTR
jgi:hypothetical protein